MPDVTDTIKKINIERWIGWVTALVMLIGWAFSFGIFYNRISSLETEVKDTNNKIEKQQELLLKQQEFNGKILTYIEIMQKQPNK